MSFDKGDNLKRYALGAIIGAAIYAIISTIIAHC